jgi:CheY-like chemotaxis protein
VEADGRPLVRNLRDMLWQALRASREVTLELSPPILHQAGLVPALRWLARFFEEKYALPVRVLSHDEATSLPESVRLFLFSAVRELLMNVVKHAHAGAATVTFDPGGQGRAVVVVEDDGIGMTGDQVLKHTEGLGLFSIRERLELLGGSVRVSTRAEGGARVEMAIPLQAVSGKNTPPLPADAGYLSGAPITARGASGEIRVLLADDHEMVRQGLGALLHGQSGFRVVGEASNGAEAIALAQRVHPDVILMDVNMPVMNGVEATRHIASRWPDIVIIGLSMHSGDDMLESMQRAGAAGYITKDQASSTLCDAVRARFRQSHPASPASTVSKDDPGQLGCS